MTCHFPPASFVLHSALYSIDFKERCVTVIEENIEPLKVNGFAVDPGLLEARPIRRCNLDECQAHCCGWGVSIRTQQVDDILAHQELILPHLPPDRRDPEKWFEGELEPEEDHPDGGM